MFYILCFRISFMLRWHCTHHYKCSYWTCSDR